METFDNAEDVLKFCVDEPDVSLVVLNEVSGGTLRAKGAIMAVTPESHAGYISNGCVDADIITRARLGQSGAFIYGEGSPFRDIILPCGGRLDVSIQQKIDRKALTSALAKLGKREETELKLEHDGVLLSPRLRLRIAGRGAACIALAELAKASGFEVHVQSPDANIYPNADHLVDSDSPPNFTDDRRTAMVCMFHDHNWEPQLLRQALNGTCFYVGAMGSEQTHHARSQNLLDLGVSQAKINKIHAPIGLISAQRDSRFLAISILAEIVQTARHEALI